MLGKDSDELPNPGQLFPTGLSPLDRHSAAGSIGHRISRNRLPRPFLKWAGGKAQLLRYLVPLAHAAQSVGTYHEPFVGGGALFFELSRLGLIKRAVLSDINRSLMDSYLGVRDHIEHVLVILGRHREFHSEDYYYEIRRSTPADIAERAARVIYLNKTGYNGLFRENRRGEFNVPFGRYIDPPIRDESNLRATHAALQQTELLNEGFQEVLDRVSSGDLVYFDPPYMPVSTTSSFTSYSAGGFREAEQKQLAEVVAELDARDIRVMVSNSFHPLIIRLYRQYNIREVLASRAVNSHPGRRGKVKELLITNF